MGSEKLGAQQIHNSHPQLVFPEAFAGGPQPHRRSAASGDPGPKAAAATRELTASFLDHHHFFQPPPPQATDFRHQWNSNSRSSGGGASEEDDLEDDDDDDDDDEDDEEDNDLENMVTVAKNNESNQNERYNNQKMKHISAFGMREGNVGQSGNENNSENKNSGDLRNMRGGEMYYAQYLNGAEGPSSSSGHKDGAAMDNGSGFSGRREGSYLGDSGDSLRTILSDPLTGTLMDDAMILRCGHSFGIVGVQQVLRMKACCTCSQSVSEDSIAPNLSLRLAVQAFKREEEMQVNHASKRKRERCDRDKGTYPDSMLIDQPRGKGVQFPFAVTDRVIIKGNKRTPQRFVGREAIVTTQCLNGWYVVKTLDNAESVKLQYRSLAKVAENNPSSKLSPIKMTPNWL